MILRQLHIIPRLGAVFGVMALVFVTVVTAQEPIKDLKPTVVLISLDGFRYDYVDKYEAPTIRRLAKDGVRAKWMIPSFPTKTFPNHYTVVTGLYPADHGIVENNVFDFGIVFTMSKREEVENPRWWGGEPIWVTAEKQGQIAASFFWVGSEAKVKGRQPTYWHRYDGNVPNEERVDSVLAWFDLPGDKRPTIITLYFSDTDGAGHGYSPDSDQVRDAVRKVDGNIARLMDGLKKRKIDKKVNIIIVSDHGMAALDQNNAVVMDEYFDFDDAERIIWTGEIVQIFPKEGKEDAIMSGLQKPGIRTKCWRKKDVPERLNYKHGARVAPIVCSSDLGWMMTSRERYEAMKKRDDFNRTRGAHGYDNKYQEMQATFIAHGKAFKKGKVVEPFENVEVYNILCKILGLSPAPNSGNLDRVRAMLR
jgi:predicted AlkP superfamily pyrophosphatase or phosphodiesterase